MYMQEDITFYKYITNELWEEMISSVCLIENNTGVCLKSLKKRDQDSSIKTDITNGHDGLVTSRKLQMKPPSSGEETNRLHRIKFIIVMSSNMNMRHFLVMMMSSPQFPSRLVSHCTSQISQSSGVNLWSFTFQDASISAW